jgi:hypothetical protein
MRTIIITNTSDVTKQWLGYELIPGEASRISNEAGARMVTDDVCLKSLVNGEMTVSDGSVVFTPAKALSYLRGDITSVRITQTSDIGDQKVWVHQSPKPESKSNQMYAVWAGASDDLVTGEIGAKGHIAIQNEVGVPHKIEDYHFVEDAGGIYIHEAYFMWADAGFGDCFSVEVHAIPSVLQTQANLDLVLAGERVAMAPGGAGTGTHGFASNPVLVPNGSNSGHWNYSSEEGLTPNMSATGDYDIRTVDTHVHTFMNQIPVYGTCQGYQVFKSHDSARLPVGYYFRVKTHNASNTEWKLFLVASLFRSRTV